MRNKSIFVVMALLAVLSIKTYAQDACQFPSGCVTVSRDVALKALADSDRVKALETELKVKDEAISGFRDELNRMRIEFARTSGEATALKTNAVRDAEIIQILLQNVKKRKYGLINLF